MLAVSLTLTLALLTQTEDAGPLKFERQRIGTTTYEACGVFDVNNDGKLDIVSGEYWFEGPDFADAHKICSIRQEGDYYDDFSNYPMDVNGDGYLDIITGGWWSESLQWRENPKGQPVEWTTHEVKKTGNNERNCFYDIDGDGDIEIIPNNPGTKEVYIFKLIKDANGKGTGEFRVTTISLGDKGQGHGIGFGDINGDGRTDIVLPHGWLEAPEDIYAAEWTYHGELNLGTASVPMLIYDVNKDGKNDIIVGQGHDYGLDWCEQQVDGGGQRVWAKHAVEPNRSQFHEMQLADLDNDGEPEVVTGKRWRAHQGHDPGANDPVGLYYYEIKGGDFKRYTMDYGSPDSHSGSGIYLWVIDIDGNGWNDVVAPGKEGMYLFRNMGK